MNTRVNRRLGVAEHENRLWDSEQGTCLAIIYGIILGSCLSKSVLARIMSHGLFTEDSNTDINLGKLL